MADAPPTSPRRVLIIKPSSLGDVVTAMPVLRGLRRAFPAAHLTWLIGTSCRGLIAHDGDLNETIPFDRARLGRWWRSPSAAGELLALLRRLRRDRYDWVIDLQGLFRSGMFSAATGAAVRAGFADAREGAPLFYTHPFASRQPHTVDRNIDLLASLGVSAAGTDMNLHVAPEARQWTEEFLRGKGLAGGDFLICVPPTRWPTKILPVRHWRTVVAALGKLLPVMLLGTANDIELCRAVAEGNSGVDSLAGLTDVPRMVGLIAASSGVICSDSAAMFIAPAVGVEVLAVIGPTRLEMTGPYPAGRAIVSDVACQGCRRRRCPHATCMELLDPQEIIASAREMLRR